MEFSLVIPAHNGGRSLEQTLSAVRRCHPSPCEVIVVDDASTDDTASIARGHGARVLSITDGPVGPAAARTEGARAAIGEVVVFTDVDVTVPANLFALLEEDFRHTDAVAVQGTFSETCPHDNYCSTYKNLYNRFVINGLPDWIDTTFTSLTAVRRDFFLTSGGFDCNISRPSVEDRTLGRNLVRAGGRILLDRRIQVVHNKRLTLKTFLINQFRRSRDLAKLLLRNRRERQMSPDAPPTVDSRGRFGTNAPSTMARIPVAYLGLASASVAGLGFSIAWVPALVFVCLFVAFAWPFTVYLIRRKGWAFALAGLPVNLLDACVSGAGVAWGVFDFLVFKRQY